jgi:type II secretory pathway component PulJ
MTAIAFDGSALQRRRYCRKEAVQQMATLDRVGFRVFRATLKRSQIPPTNGNDDRPANKDDRFRHSKSKPQASLQTRVGLGLNTAIHLCWAFVRDGPPVLTNEGYRARG